MEKIRYYLYRADEYLTVLYPFLLVMLFLFCLNSCSPIKEIPVEYIEKTIYKDSTIYINDTVLIEIPYEVVKEVIPDIDTSIISTNYAISTAFIDKDRKKLHHTLEQQGEIRTVIDTFYVTKTVEKQVLKEVPVPVEVIKYKRDQIFWISLIFNLLVVAVTVFRLWLKTKLRF